jgi:hypothetical protein
MLRDTYRLTSCILVLLLLLSLLPACAETADPGVVSVGEAPPTRPDREAPDPDVADPGALDADGTAPGEVVVGRADAPAWNPMAPTLAGPPTTLTGQFDCLGDNLPMEPTGETFVVTGRTYLFGTPMVAPSSRVVLRDAQGDELSSAVSDEMGFFDLEIPDTKAARDGDIEVSGFGLFPVSQRSTHFARTWLSGNEIDVLVMSPSVVDLFELATGLDAPLDRGAIHGKIFDCAGEAAVANAWVTVEPAGGLTFYARPNLGLTSNEGGTTEVSQFFVFDLEPGDYVVTVWGRLDDGAAPIAINRAHYVVEAGALSTQRIYPE